MTFPEKPSPQTQTKRSERTRLSRAQRRRAQRGHTVPTSVEGRSALLKNLVERAYPSYEFFLFAAFCGAILGVGYIFDAQAFLIFGILMSPLMTPWVGMTLATITGSVQFFIKTLGAFFVGALLVFITGALAGLASRIWLPLTLNQAFMHSRLWWPDLVALALGAILLTASFVRSEKKPFLPSVMVAYELFLPLSATAFGLGSGVGDLWPQGLMVFAIHLVWGTLFGALTLGLLGFRPVKAGGYLFAAGTLFLAVIAFVSLSGIMPTSTPVPVISAEADIPPAAAVIPSTTNIVPASSTPQVASNATPSRTPTAHITIELTSTATQTLTPEPTPLYARVSADRGGGAYVRREPGGPVILTVANGDLVEVLSDPIEGEGGPWVHVVVVRDTQRIEGWIIQAVLQTATPAPGW